MSSSTSAWLLSPLECSPQNQNGCRLIEEKDSKDTKRATKASVKVFNEYSQEKILDKPHYDDKVTLTNVLTRFYAEARKR